MTRTLFNDGWSYRPAATAFHELASAGVDWQAIRLPHDALISVARQPGVEGGETSGYFPGGAFQYRRTLNLPDQVPGTRVWLDFDGVYRDAMVYVNNALAGQRASGYSRFNVRIDPYLKPGMDNEIRVDCRTHLDSRWYAGAGIYRDVHLVTKPAAHLAIDGVRVTTPDVDAERAVVMAAVTVDNTDLASKTLTVSVEVVDGSGRVVATSRAPITLLPTESGTVRRRLYVENPLRWSVDSPNLYQLRVELRDREEAIDGEVVPFGVRSIRIDPVHGLRINDEIVKLRGACIHADNGPLGMAAFARAEERKVAGLKVAGFNAVRSAHHPISSAFLDACDRLGMIVMDETFDVWTSPKTNDDYAVDFPQWWERDVEAMVAKDRNHPSVVFYSIGNEIPETGNEIAAAWSRRLAEKVRSLDDTRLVTNGVNAFVAMLDLVIPAMRERRRGEGQADGGVNALMAGFSEIAAMIQTSPEATNRTEESFAVLDVAGMNYAADRYELDRELFPDRVIVGTETWPTHIARNWALVVDNGHVIGDFTWTGWDYLGENGVGVVRYVDDFDVSAGGFATPYPGLTAYCGDIDITGFRRPVSYYREIVFGLRHDPYLAVRPPQHFDRELAVTTMWAWSDAIESWSWAGEEGRPVRIEVYSAADEVELLLDGRPVGRRAVGGELACRAVFELTYHPGELECVAYADGQPTGRASLRSAADRRVVVATPDRDMLDAEGGDLCFVDVALTDGTGVVHTGSDRAVRVTVAGPAVLQALGSANPITEETFCQPTHETYNGRALAIIRPTGAGEITVVVGADGFEPATCVLRAVQS